MDAMRAVMLGPRRHNVLLIDRVDDEQHTRAPKLQRAILVEWIWHSLPPNVAVEKSASFSPRPRHADF